MNAYSQILDLINTIFIKGIFVSVLVIICSRLVFKRIDTRNALVINRWILLSYSILCIIHLLILCLLPESSTAFWEQATGRYNFAFWLMMSSPFLPLLLFVKSLRNNIYILLFMAIWVNIGSFMEWLVIHTIMIYRDYTGNVKDFPTIVEWMIILEGVLLGILTLVIGNSFVWMKKKTNGRSL